jgi:alpha-galactosidase
MSKQIKPFYTLNAYQTSLVLDCRNNAPAIVYWGPRLSEHTQSDSLAQLSQFEEAPASPRQQAPVSLSPELGLGFQGNPGIEVHRQGQQWGLYTQIKSVTESDNQLTITSLSESADIVITHSLGLDPISGVLTASTQLTNTGDTKLSLQQCYAPSIPLPMHLTKILGFKGRWANEFQVQSIDRFIGAYVRENRSGRTSHDSFPGVIVHAEHTNESVGEAYGFHLGWSGNHQMRIEEQSSGRAYAQLGELLYPGEICLKPNQSYQSPTLYGATSQQGLNGLSHCFHRYIRSHLL